MATHISFLKERVKFAQRIFTSIAILTLCLGSTSVAQTPAAADKQTAKLLAQQSATGSPRDRVKIIVDGNRLILIGSTEDVLIIKNAYELVRQKLKAAIDPIVSERVVLRFQMSDVVATMMKNSMGSAVTGTPVQVEALHFPESVLLIGPASSIKQAKKLLKTIDSHALEKASAKPAKPIRTKLVY